MEVIISFFRDFLSGPLYTVVVVINSILICAGIGYFAEKSQNNKRDKQKYKDTHVNVNNVSNQSVNYTTNVSVGANLKSTNASVNSNVTNGVNSPIIGNMVNQNISNSQIPNNGVTASIQNNVNINK